MLHTGKVVMTLMNNNICLGMNVQILSFLSLFLDGVRVRVVVGVVRALKARRKHKRFVISSDSVFRLRHWWYDLVESEGEAEKPTNHKAWSRTLWLVYSASASDSDNKVDRCSTLLITTLYASDYDSGYYPVASETNLQESRFQCITQTAVQWT